VTDKIPAKFHDEISEFVRQYNEPVYRHLLTITQRDHALAEDLTQQVLMGAAEDWPKIRALDDSGQRNRLYVMAVRRAIDAFRKNATARKYELLEPPAPAPAETDPCMYVVSAETIALFVSVLKSMPSRQAQAAALSWFYRWKNVEIAQEFGITPGAVSHLLRRARTRIVSEAGPYLLDDLRDPEGGA
jgi:RNA polymerase sigma factor (sigma-70 family)